MSDDKVQFRLKEITNDPKSTKDMIDLANDVKNLIEQLKPFVDEINDLKEEMQKYPDRVDQYEELISYYQNIVNEKKFIITIAKESLVSARLAFKQIEEASVQMLDHIENSLKKPVLRNKDKPFSKDVFNVLVSKDDKDDKDDASPLRVRNPNPRIF